MSVILDALKKLDREKSRRGGAASIAAEILKAEPSPSGKRFRLYLAAFSLTAVAAAAVTYGIVLKSDWVSKPTPPVVVDPPVPSQQAVSIPLATPDEIRRFAPRKQTPVESERPIEIRKPAEIKKPAEVKEPAEIKKPEQVELPAQGKTSEERERPGIPLGEKKITQEIIPEPPGIAPEKARTTPEPIPIAASTTPPSLKLTAIGWYEEPSNRFAVINGMMVTVGTVIDGAKVMEVNPTSVRFLHNGQVIDVSIK